MRELLEPENGVFALFNFDRFGLPDEALEPLKQDIRDTAPTTFDAFCEMLNKAVRDRGGDPRYEIARMQALRTHEPVEAEAIAAAAVAADDAAKAEWPEA